MTFNSAPWAIDGARTTAALARLATYTTGGGRSGVTKPSDLRVLPLTVPGNGLRITTGGATVLNHYLVSPDEAYVVSNPSTHTVLAADMPPAVPALSYYLVCVVVGDPEFNQTGHPYMPSVVAPEDAATFEYVRIVIVPCNADTTSFEALGLNYPAYALARLEIPANTTTITSEMILDLRDLAQPRSQRDLNAFTPPDTHNLIDAGWDTWPMVSGYTVSVPEWATKANIIATITGVAATEGSTTGGIRILVSPAIGSPEVLYDIDTPAGAGFSREILVAAFSGDISSIAGTDTTIYVQGYRDAGSTAWLTTFPGSQLILDVEFSEDTV
jgi:hypothetical protein